MSKINHEEYEVLKDLDDRWKWIARNYNGALITYTDKPTKNPNLYWDSFGERMEDRLFQFIQWEDEEPYNIAELIREYEYTADYYASQLAKLSKVIYGNESEETEVKKNIEWLKDILFDENVIRLFPNDIEKLHELINQLDEPEVLSQEWIEENKEDSGVHYIGYYVPIGRLHDLLVPKQEKVKVPKFVGVVIELYKKYGNSLTTLLADLAYHGELQVDSIDFVTSDTMFDWADENSDTVEEIIARAWLNGYEIEEEPKYYVYLGDGHYLVSEDKLKEPHAKIRHELVGGFANYVLSFTEQEIKDYDPRYWTFRRPVEEI